MRALKVSYSDVGEGGENKCSNGSMEVDFLPF